MWKQGYPGKTNWTDAQLAYLREHFPSGTISDIAYELGMSPGTVSSKAKELGLKRAEGWSKQNFNCRYVKNYKHRNVALREQVRVPFNKF